MQFAHFFETNIQGKRKKNDLTFRLQSDQGKINVNVFDLLGIDHLDNVPLVFQSCYIKEENRFSPIGQIAVGYI